MKSTFLIAAICIGFSVGRPAESMIEEEFAKYQMTPEKISDILKAYEHYKEFIPESVYNILANLSDETKAQIAQMINDYHSGKFETPKDVNGLLSIIKKDYPLISPAATGINDFYRQKLALLGPKAQELFNKWEAQGYADANPDKILWACHLFNNIPTIVSELQGLLQDSDEAEKIDEQFPELQKFLHSKEYEAYTIVVKQMKTLDCEKDRDQVFNTIKLFDMHNVLTTKE
ncbi:unnamed protein product [Caenorhabditis bovis]|uniref:SXP/RAL-2 family protein Ani s 5-like cation-binding domain-containing protein n=1 Tax=Caenorhabditis bovis TaxID=2654633 RepID=A0A8S1ELZ5_9PELO|nr:unnamed protein product [Caenorhabditis bovis]